MATAPVNLPEGFVLDEASPDINMGEGLDRLHGRVTPETQKNRDLVAASMKAQYDTNPAYESSDIQVRNPSGKPQPASTLPSGFVVDQAQQPQAPANPLYGILQKGGVPIKAGTAQQGDVTGDAGDYILNRAKLGLFAAPGLVGSAEGWYQAGAAALDRALSIPPAVRTASEAINPLYWIENGIKAARGMLGQQTQTALPTAEEAAQKLLGYNPNLKPETKMQEFAGDVAEFASSMGTGLVAKLLNGAGGAALKEAANIIGLSTVAAGGGMAAESAIGENAKPYGQLLGAIPYSALSNRAKAIGMLLNSETRAQMGAAVRGDVGQLSADAQDILRRQAEETLRSGIKEYPQSLTNIKEATDLQARINDALKDTGQSVTMSAGRASASPRIVADELNARSSSNSSIAAALQDDQRNFNSVLSYMSQKAAPDMEGRTTTIDNLINDYNSARDTMIAQEKSLQDKAAELTEGLLPKMTAEQRGQSIVQLRLAEKAKEDTVRNQLYGVARDEANSLGATFDRGAIDDVAQRIAQNPILQYDANNMPAVIRNILGTTPTADENVAKALANMPTPAWAAPDKKAQLLQRLHQAYEDVAPKEPLKFDDIAAMKQAVNQDIAVELRSTNPNKRQRLRALTEMGNTIDGAIAESNYPTVAQLYGAANDYYKTTYAPKFNKGINAKLAMTDSLGQSRVLDEKVMDQYAGSVNGANQFLKLFGNNPEAKAVMEDHLLDSLSRAASKDGQIQVPKFDAWLTKNNDMLRTLEAGGIPSLERLRDAQGALKLMNQRAAWLAGSQEIMAKDQLTRMLGTAEHSIIMEKAMQSPAAMERLTTALGEDGSRALATSVLRDVQNKFTFDARSGGVGVDAKKFSDWLRDNGASLKILFKEAWGGDKYGPSEGLAHYQRLLDANRMLAIQQRIQTPDFTRAGAGFSADIVSRNLGFSFRTLFNMLRAVIQHRTSPPDVAVALGGQAATHLATKAYNNLMAKIATDPESSKYLLDLVQGDAKKVLTKDELAKQSKAVAGLLGTIGLKVFNYYSGTSKYIPNALKLAPVLIANEQQRRQ